MKKIIIGLLGESRTGKDWIGSLISQHISSGKHTLIKAADVLKNEAELRYPGIFSTEVWENSGEKYREEIVESIQISRRQILQNIGVELIEKNPNYVYNYLRDSLKSSEETLTIISDLRNELECKAVRDSGGTVIKVVRSLEDRYPKLWEKYKNSEELDFKEFLKIEDPKLYKKLNHATELSVDKVSSSFYNFTFENKEKISSNNTSRSFESLILKLRAI
jgi:hypothetical protein